MRKLTRYTIFPEGAVWINKYFNIVVNGKLQKKKTPAVKRFLEAFDIVERGCGYALERYIKDEPQCFDSEIVHFKTFKELNGNVKAYISPDRGDYLTFTIPSAKLTRELERQHASYLEYKLKMTIAFNDDSLLIPERIWNELLKIEV